MIPRDWNNIFGIIFNSVEYIIFKENVSNILERRMSTENTIQFVLVNLALQTTNE